MRKTRVVYYALRYLEQVIPEVRRKIEKATVEGESRLKIKELNIKLADLLADYNCLSKLV